MIFLNWPFQEVLFTYVLTLKLLFTLLLSDFVKSKLVNGHYVLHSLPKHAVCKVSNWTKSNLPPSSQGFPINIRWDKISKVPKCTHVFGKVIKLINIFLKISSIIYVGIFYILTRYSLKSGNKSQTAKNS